MSNLSIFIWNDVETTAIAWKDIATGAGFKKTNYSASTDIDRVLEEYSSEYYDIAILDVVLNDDDEFGLKVAKEIRKTDKFVPIIAVTRFPEKVYGNLDLEECQLAGIYHASIMHQDSFEGLLVRQSLNQCQIAFPEYVLVRKCLWHIYKTFKDTDTYAFLKPLADGIERLPCSNSIESWHSQLCEIIEDRLSEKGWQGVKNAYKRIAKLFQESDPFYMAVKLGRRHLSHNTQVFLMGVILILEDTKLRDAVQDQLKQYCSDDPYQALLDAILIWSCISTTHDVAYLGQHMKTIVDKLITLSEGFKASVERVSSGSVNSLSECEWPEAHHAKIGAALWVDCMSGSDGYEAEICRIISDAIKRHDSNQEEFEPVDSNNWAMFLAVLCDELQNWHRERHELEPGSDPNNEIPWRVCALETFLINKDSAGIIELSMHFVAKDFPNIVADVVGRTGKRTIERNVSKTCEILKKNLFYDKLTIELSVEIITRNIDDVIKKVILDGT